MPVRHPRATWPVSFFALAAGLLSLSLLLPVPSQAQSIKLDGSLGSRTTLTGPAYTIPHDLGQTRGANLFHSFEQFNILTGESATFTGPNTVQRVISRVTGGVQSFIDGLLGTEFAGAKPEFYLINPSGLLFGPNASLNVSGSVHFSTADYLRFADQVGQMGLFARLSETTTLSTEPVAAFGFMGPTAASITVQRSVDGFLGGADFSVPGGSTLSLIGGDLTISAEPILGQFGIPSISATSGRIQLAAMKSAGQVPANVAEFNVSQAGPQGAITASQGALIDASGDGGGIIAIRGGKLTLDGALMFADNHGDSSGPSIGIDLGVTGGVHLMNGSFVTTDVLAGGGGGSIKILADTLTMSDGSVLGSRGVGLSSGNTGNLTIDAKAVTLANSNIDLSTQPLASGLPGHMLLNVEQLKLIDGGFISTVVGGASGGIGGSIRINATDSILISGMSAGGTLSGIVSNSLGSADAGSLLLQANTVRISSGGQLQAITLGSGRGGDITLVAGDLLTVEGRNQPYEPADPLGFFSIPSAILSNSRGSGAAGDIHVKARTMMIDDAAIQAATLGGDPGVISIDVGDLNLTNRAAIESGNLGAKKGGAVIVTAERSVRISGRENPLTLDGFENSLISVESFGFGETHAGSIEVRSPLIEIRGGGGLSARTLDLSEGDIITTPGQVLLDAAMVEMTGGGRITASGLGRGAAGSIDITASESIHLEGTNPRGIQSGIESVTVNSSIKGGTITLAAPEITVTNNARVATTTRGSGDSGDISINATRLFSVEEGAGVGASTFGSGNAGDITITSPSILIGNDTLIASRTTQDGSGGDLRLIAETSLVLREKALVTAEGTGLGDSGDISLRSGDTILLTDATVATQAIQADGGNIKLTAPNVIRLGNSQVTSSVGGGPTTTGGNINIDPQFVVVQNSQIRANAFAGTGGNIVIAGNVVMVDPASVIDASSALGVSGQVAIQAPVNNIAAALSRLSQQTLNAAELLTARCSARLREGTTSSLTLAGRDGVPAEPGSYRPTAFVASAYRPTGAPTVAARPSPAARPPLLLQSPSPELYALRDAAPLPLGCGS